MVVHSYRQLSKNINKHLIFLKFRGHVLIYQQFITSLLCLKSFLLFFCLLFFHKFSLFFFFFVFFLSFLPFLLLFVTHCRSSINLYTNIIKYRQTINYKYNQITKQWLCQLGHYFLIYYIFMVSLINSLFQIIRNTCKQSKYCLTIPVNQQKLTEESIKQYIKAMEFIQSYIRSLEEENQKLQSFLQKSQTQLRRHIGFKQELQLFTDNLKDKLEESTYQKQEILQKYKEKIKFLEEQIEKLLKGQNNRMIHQLHLNSRSKIKRSEISQEKKQQRKINSHSPDIEVSRLDHNSKFSYPNYTLLAYLSKHKKQKNNNNSIAYQDNIKQFLNKNAEYKKHHVSTYKFNDYQEKIQKHKVSKSVLSTEQPKGKKTGIK